MASSPTGEKDVSTASSDDSASGSSPSNTWLSALCPLLRAFSGEEDPSSRPRWLEVATSGLASFTRMPYGTSAGGPPPPTASQPTEPIRLYEFEACPFCRRVREAVTDLDLAVEVYPCPKGALRHRDAVLQAGGKAMFPYIVDGNTGKEMYESEEIVRYLYERYGGREVPEGLLESTKWTGWMPTLLRIGRGMVRYKGATEEAPQKMLELYNYENNQFARLVREVLCELELPYRIVSAGKGSPNREKLKSVSGKTTVPFLVDPNNGVEMGESEDIIEYLYKTYSQPLGSSA